MTDFALDERLAADTVPVARLRLSDLLLMEDARFPWLLLVPRRGGASEIVDLADEDQRALLREIADVSAALRAATGCDKLNVAALGNVVPQLHVHIVARFRHDTAWPKPVWGSGAAIAYEPTARDKLAGQIRSFLSD
jgi:diadenosine tetraphosphate (Ap4A) HIT family hydrolase